MYLLGTVVLFSLYSVFGWTIDTAWRSFQKRRYTRGGFSKYPFSPIYGFGAFLALGLHPIFRPWPLWQQWLFLSCVFGAFEYVCGVLVVKFMKRRLWNYTKEPFDLKGHTTLLYAMMWGVLALLVVSVFQPALETFCTSLRICARLLL